MHKFTIDKLSCNTVSTDGAEHGGTDSLLLDVQTDDRGREPYSPHPVLRAGESWEVDDSFPFDDVVTLSLHLWPDIGEASKRISGEEIHIEGISPRSGIIRLEETDDGTGDYSLEYTVTPDAFPNPPVDIVDHAIEKFETSPIHGTWLNLDGSAVKPWIAHLAKRPIGNRPLPEKFDQQNDQVDDPFEVQQDGIGYCTMAAVEFSLAYTRPRRFVEACRAIYETGSVVGQYHVLRASTDLLRSPSPTRDYRSRSWLGRICKKEYTIPEGDWMVMALLQDTGDFWEWKDEDADGFPDPPPPSAIRGISYEQLLENGTVAGLEYMVREFAGLEASVQLSSNTSGVGCLLRAATAIRNGGIGILVIDTDLLYKTVPADISRPFVYNHAVSLYRDATGNVLEQTSNTFKFKVHSWGRSFSIDFPGQQINQLVTASVVGE